MTLQRFCCYFEHQRFKGGPDHETLNDCGDLEERTPNDIGYFRGLEELTPDDIGDFEGSQYRPQKTSQLSPRNRTRHTLQERTPSCH